MLSWEYRYSRRYQSLLPSKHISWETKNKPRAKRCDRHLSSTYWKLYDALCLTIILQIYKTCQGKRVGSSVEAVSFQWRRMGETRSATVLTVLLVVYSRLSQVRLLTGERSYIREAQFTTCYNVTMRALKATLATWLGLQREQCLLHILVCNDHFTLIRLLHM